MPRTSDLVPRPGRGRRHCCSLRSLLPRTVARTTPPALRIMFKPVTTDPPSRQRAGVLLFYLALPRPTSLYLALPRSTSLYLALPRPISPYLALPRSTSLYLALPRPTSPHLAHQQGGRDLPAERPGLTSRAGTYQQGRDLRDRRGPGKRGGTGETGGGHSISPFVALSCCGLSASMTDSYTYPKHPNTCDPMSSQLIATHVSFHTNTTFTPTKRL